MRAAGWDLAALVSVFLWASTLCKLVHGVEADPLTWRRLSPSTGAAPEPRRNPALVHDPKNNRLVLFGGRSADGRDLSDTWTFDLATSVWERMATSNDPPGRWSFVYGLHYTDTAYQLVISLGQAGGGQLNDIWALPLAATAGAGPAQWRQLPGVGDVPERRYGSAGGVLPGSDRFYISHGFSKTRLGNMYVYDLGAGENKWIKVEDGSNPFDPSWPHPRCLVSSALAVQRPKDLSRATEPLAQRDGFLVMFGGCLQNGLQGGPCPHRDVWSYPVPAGGRSAPLRYDNDWERGENGPSPRNYGAMTRLPPPYENAVMLLGGEESTKQTITAIKAPEDEVAVLFIEPKGSKLWGRKVNWERFRTQGEVPAFRHSAAATAEDATAYGCVYLFGGILRSNGTFANDLHCLSGNPLKSPTSSSSTRWFIYPHLHGLFMFLSWGIMLQAGWFIARYFKVHDPMWFKLHRILQVTGLMLALVGFALVFVGGSKAPALAHAITGFVVMLLGLLQPVNAYFRPHKGQKWRTQWEWLHKMSGRVAALFGLINCSLGSFLLDSTFSAVIIVWHTVLGIMVVVFLAFEVRHQRRLRAQRAAAASQTPKEAEMRAEENARALNEGTERSSLT